VLTIFDLEDGSSEQVAIDEFDQVGRVSWSPSGDWLVMRARSLTTPRDDGGIWAYQLDSGDTWQVSANTAVLYEWTETGQLLNTRTNRDGTYYFVTDVPTQQSDLVPGLGVACNCEPKGYAVWGVDLRWP